MENDFSSNNRKIIFHETQTWKKVKQNKNKIQLRSNYILQDNEDNLTWVSFNYTNKPEEQLLQLQQEPQICKKNQGLPREHSPQQLVGKIEWHSNKKIPNNILTAITKQIVSKCSEAQTAEQASSTVDFVKLLRRHIDRDRVDSELTAVDLLGMGDHMRQDGKQAADNQNRCHCRCGAYERRPPAEPFERGYETEQPKHQQQQQPHQQQQEQEPQEQQHQQQQLENTTEVTKNLSQVYAPFKNAKPERKNLLHLLPDLELPSEAELRPTPPPPPSPPKVCRLCGIVEGYAQHYDHHDFVTVMTYQDLYPTSRNLSLSARIANKMCVMQLQGDYDRDSERSAFKFQSDNDVSDYPSTEYLSEDIDTEDNQTDSTHSIRRPDSITTLNEVWVNPDNYLDIKLKNNVFQPDGPYKYPAIKITQTGHEGLPRYEHDELKAHVDRSVRMTTAFDALSRKRRLFHTAQHVKQLREFQRNAVDDFNKTMPHHVSSDDELINHPPYKFAAPDCPLKNSGCTGRPSGCYLFSHFLKCHVNDQLAYNEINSCNKVMLVLQPRLYRRSENVCLMVLLYGGYKGRKIIVTMKTHVNYDMPQPEHHLVGHVPVLIMACRTRLATAASPDEGVQIVDPTSQSSGESVLALWPITPHMQQQIHVHMSVFNRRMDIVRTCIVQARSLHKSHEIKDILSSSKSYMRVTSQDLRLLTNNYQEPHFFMEVFVREFGPHNEYHM